MTEAVGFIAAVLTTTAFVPQFIKVWKTRSTQSISLRMYLMLCTGVLLWLVYGFEIRSLPVILANGVTLVLTLAILVLKIRYK
ncbi:MAG: SemiSWEET transporter [Bacteroidetes bacterium]|nr:SemiSWEET transporter [Bacteroidota bacterium]MCL5738147.1 SemiSWEET transporter [Bacteroidota bacterium]